MKTLLFTVVFCLSASIALATDWSKTLEGITKAVLRVEMQFKEDRSMCSAGVINAQEGYALTAAHCIVDEASADHIATSITVSKRHATVVKMNRILDLAVLKFSSKDDLELTLAPEDPKLGSEIAVLGYPFTATSFMAQFGHVTHPSYENEMWVNVDVLFGDSGGPVINLKGEIVGVTSAILSSGPAHVGMIVPVEHVRDFVKEFLPKPKK